MAGQDDDPNLKGLSRYFNSQTNRGRANVSNSNIVLLKLNFLLLGSQGNTAHIFFSIQL